MYLGMAHAHFDPEGRVTRFGSHYVNHFILFDTRPPYKTRHLSPAFCFPAGSDPENCEVIQFVTSMFLNGTTVVIAYGINDCESMIVRVPLATLLDFTRQFF
jgi:hypothetical protein